MNKIDWEIAEKLIDYEDAVSYMEQHIKKIHESVAQEKIWLLEHPPIYTAGTSTNKKDLLDPCFPVYQTGRGGELTYHGPGQRIAYVMLDLASRNKKDVRLFVWTLEQWIINTLQKFDIKAERREGRVGLWVVLDTQREEKIAAIGIRIRKWVTYHGVSINLNPDLSHFNGIVPCGIREHGVTSFEKLNKSIKMEELDVVLKQQGEKIFNDF